MKRRIIDAQLQAGPKSKSGDEVWDTVLPGFGYRKTKPGRAGYFIRYRDLAGKQRRQSIGKYPALDLDTARERARELLRAAGRGSDVKLALTALSAPEGDQNISVAALVERYLVEYAEKRTRPRTYAETRRIFEVYVLPRFGGHRITDVDPLDILAFIQEMAKKTPTMANRTHSALSRFWRWVVNQADLNRLGIQHNPFRDFDKPAGEVSRDRTLTDDELARTLKAAREIGGPYGAVTEMLLRTGLRRSEVADLRWDQVDLEKLEITFMGSDTKGGQAMTVPITPRVAELLEQQPKDNEHVFPSPRTGGPLTGFSKFNKKLWALADVDNAVLHDLRRTLRTNLSRLNVEPHIAERVLGHTIGGVAGVYDRHDHVEQKRTALQQYEVLLAQIDSGGKVVAIGGAR
jgi:integrase